ncbi:MAG: hypothetical protein AAF799_09845 [Myxococcota bacterium]
MRSSRTPALRRFITRASLASVLLSLGCAARHDPPPLAPAAEKTKHAWVEGTAPQAQALCDAFTETADRDACQAIASTRHFDAQALALCAESAPDAPPQALQCARMIAERSYTPRSLETCRGYEGSDRIDCLEVMADRRLSTAQIQECRTKKRTGAELRCLRKARDHVFDLEMLHQIAIDSALHPPSLEPIPYPPQKTPVPDPDLDAARDRVHLHNQVQMQALFDRTRRGVTESFPTVQLEPTEQSMVWNFAGGALGHYRMLYCSRREYLIIFGTPMGVNGYSGRYTVDVHDWTMIGEMRTHHVGDLEPRVMAPGSWAKLMAGDTKIYTAEPNTYMLEYARGKIVSAFDFGVTAPARNMSRDFHNMRKQIRACLDGAIPNASRQRRRMRALKKQGREVRRDIDEQLRSEGHKGRLR